MDFKLDDNLDLNVTDGIYTEQQDGETTMLQAFFTDTRINGLRGYWLEIQSSEIWKHEQSRLTDETARDLNETAKEVAKELVEIKLYEKITTETFIDDGVLTLQIKCYNDKKITFDRKFVI